MNIVSAIALLILAAIAFGLCLALALSRASRSRLDTIGVFLIGAVLGALYADKPTPIPSATLRWDTGLADNGSVATNDLVFIRGTYDQLMATDALHIDYRPKSSTDPFDWMRGYDGVVSALSAGFTVLIPDATNMVIYIWSEYIPPSPIHTNGEYRATYVGSVTNSPPDAPRYVTPRTPIKGKDDEGEEIHLAPPPTN